jgi:acyl carrier protein
MNTFDKVVALIAERRDLDTSTVKPETTFDELKLDSLDKAELVMSLEETFGITIDTAEQMKTIGDVVALVEQP